MLSHFFDKGLVHRLTYFFFTLVVIVGVISFIDNFWLKQAVLLSMLLVLDGPLIRWLDQREKTVPKKQ